MLRVATTDSSGAKSQSFVTALQRALGAAREDRPGRRARARASASTRCASSSDRGYVVTFRQIDPLFTLDLADPTHPRVRGELKIVGYSAYLHPVGAHRAARRRAGRDAAGPPGGHAAVAVRRRRPRRAEAAAARSSSAQLHLDRGRVRPPRVPVVGAAAAGGDPGLRLRGRRPREARGLQGRPRAGSRRPAAATRTASCCARWSSAGAPAHAQRPRAERLRPRHARAGAGRALLSSASSARGAALQPA